MIKILVILNSFGTDGISNNTMNYYKFYKKDKIHLDFVFGQMLKPKQEWLRMLEEEKSKIYLLPGRKKRPFQYIKKLRKIIREGKYDIVHAMGSSSILTLEMFSAYKEGVKVRIAHSRNTECDHKFLNFILKPFFYKYTNYRFACGKEAGEWLFGKRPFLVINNGNDFEKFKYSSNCSVNFDDNKLNIVSTGAINHQKNYLFMAKVIKKMSEQNNNFCYYIVGNKNNEAELNKLENYINENNLNKFIKLVGVVDNPQDYLSAADIFAFPSLFEGFPNGLIEAQISGIPCVVSLEITKDACLCDNVFRIGIEDKDIDSWVKTILSIGITFDRAAKSDSNIGILRNNGYDIKENAQFLENKYIELYNDNYSKK